MWCTEVAAGASLIFRIVVSGDIGDHKRCTGRCAEKRLQRSNSIARNMIFNRVIR
jgi:hypothetical protein